MLTVTLKRKKGQGFGFSLANVHGPTKISQVAPGSEAEKAGLRVGDAIFAINGERLHSRTYEETAALIQQHKGKTLKIIVRPAAEGEARIRVCLRPQEIASEKSQQVGFGRIHTGPKGIVPQAWCATKRTSDICRP